MSNPLAAVDLEDLEAVTAGASRCTPQDPLLRNFTLMSNALGGAGCAARKTGLSTVEVLMFGLLMSRNRTQVNVFVRRPYW